MNALALIPVAAMRQAMKRASTSTLQRTIANSQARIAAGLTGIAEQNEINRIQAAANELEARGAGNTPATKAATKSNAQGEKGTGNGLLFMALAGFAIWKISQ